MRHVQRSMVLAASIALISGALAGSATGAPSSAQDSPVTTVALTRLVVDVAGPAVREVKRKSWKKIRITVTNPSTRTARKVKITLRGSGTGISKKSVTVGTIAAGRTKTKSVKIRLVSGKKRTIKVSATGKGVAAGTDRLVLEVAPKPGSAVARPGAYSGSLNGGEPAAHDISFRVSSNGRTLSSFGGYAYVYCYSFYPYLTITPYARAISAPTFPISKSGKVDSTIKRTIGGTEETYTMKAQFSRDGVKSGTFSFEGGAGLESPGTSSGCFLTDATWSATR